MVIDNLSRHPELLDRWPMGIMALDGENRIESVNRPLCYSFGLEPSDILGRDVRAAFPRESVTIGEPGLEQDIGAWLEQARSTGRAMIERVLVEYKGRRRYFQLTMLKGRPGPGSSDRGELFILSQEITSRVVMEQVLTESVEDLLIINRGGEIIATDQEVGQAADKILSILLDVMKVEMAVFHVQHEVLSGGSHGQACAWPRPEPEPELSGQQAAFESFALAAGMQAPVRFEARFDSLSKSGLSAKVLHVLKEGGSVFDNEPGDELYPPVGRLERKRIRSYLCSPLLSRGKALGIIELINKESGGFSEHDREIILTLSNQIGIYLENHRLHQELISTNRNLDRRVELMSKVERISTSLLQRSGSIEDVLSSLIDGMVNLFGYPNAYFLLHNPAANALEGKVFRESGSNLDILQRLVGINLEDHSFGLGDDKSTFMHQVLDTGKPYFSNSISEIGIDMPYQSLFNLGTRLFNINSLAFIPVHGHDRVLGVIVLATPDSVFTEEEINVLTTLSNQAGLIIENARLYKDLEQNLEQLSRTQEQLIHTEKLAAVGRLAAKVAHEINNPISIILGFAQLLREQAGAEAPSAQQLERIEKESLRCRRVVQELLDFTRVGKPFPAPEDPVELLRESVSSLKAGDRLEGIELTVKVDRGLPRIMVDAEQIRQVLGNILFNGVQAMEGGGSLTAGVKRDRDMVRFWVSDTGHGIPQEKITQIFEPFYTSKRKGTGLGLAVALSIVQKHGGKIEVQSSPGRGATFWVIFPAEQETGTRVGTDKPA